MEGKVCSCPSFCAPALFSSFSNIGSGFSLLTYCNPQYVKSTFDGGATRMTKNTVKKILIGILAVVVVTGGYVAYEVHGAMADYKTMRPCDLQAAAHPNEASAKFLLPCYESAAKNSPNDQQVHYELGCALVSTGRDDEARPIFEKLSHLWGSVGSDSRQMLLPGAMQKQKEMDDQAQRNWQDRQALSLKNQAEERDFLRLHAVVHDGVIVQVSAADKAVWLAMRDRHSKEIDAFVIGYRKQ